MMSHDNVIWNTQNIIDALGPFEMAQQTVVSYLPLSHIAAPFVDIFLSISLAATVYFADKNALKGSLVKTLVEVKPIFVFGVPRVFEKIQEKLVETLNESKGFKKSLVLWAQSAALNFHKNRIEGKNPFPLQYMIAKLLVLNKIKAALGLNRADSLVTGSAPTSMETLEFFLSLDMPLLDAFGMTEGTGVMFSNTPRETRLGSVGKCVAGIEAKIENANDEGFGEICTRGRNTFMGYINEPEKTREAVDSEGWIHSGDVGYIDSDGFLHMTGRIKELIITAGGENVPFLHIENLVKGECHAISNTFLVGDKKKFLTMLVSLKTQVNGDGVPCDELAPESLKLMKDLGLKHTLLSDVLAAGPDINVVAALQAAVDRANKKAISNAQKVQKFAILPNEFSLPTGELNPTMKLKRNFVLTKYKDMIEKMYS
jgi:long-chain-fatty-acid--CoA ligase ACSBG